MGSTVFLFLALLCVNADALYFYVDGGEEKCFIQELANQTLLKAKYKCSGGDYEGDSANVGGDVDDDMFSKDGGMMVEIKDPGKKIVMSRLYNHEGEIKYKSRRPGEHSVCLHPMVPYTSMKKTRIDFDLQVGQHAANRSKHKKTDPLSIVEERYEQLLEKAAEIVKEIDYLRYREELFRGISESISQRVLLWMVGETLLLIIIGVWQVENLRTFFESKKLV